MKRITTDTTAPAISWAPLPHPDDNKSKIFWVAGVNWCAEAG
jgi:hypothetical protein